MPMRNSGCWNWMPQPICAPTLLSAASTAASKMNEAITPAAEATKRARIAPASREGWPSNEKA